MDIKNYEPLKKRHLRVHTDNKYMDGWMDEYMFEFLYTYSEQANGRE